MHVWVGPCNGLFVTLFMSEADLISADVCVYVCMCVCAFLCVFACDTFRHNWKKWPNDTVQNWWALFSIKNFKPSFIINPDKLALIKYSALMWVPLHYCKIWHLESSIVAFKLWFWQVAEPNWRPSVADCTERPETWIHQLSAIRLLKRVDGADSCLAHSSLCTLTSLLDAVRGVNRHPT